MRRIWARAPGTRARSAGTLCKSAHQDAIDADGRRRAYYLSQHAYHTRKTRRKHRIKSTIIKSNQKHQIKPKIIKSSQKSSNHHGHDTSTIRSSGGTHGHATSTIRSSEGTHGHDTSTIRSSEGTHGHDASTIFPPFRPHMAPEVYLWCPGSHDWRAHYAKPSSCCLLGFLCEKQQLEQRYVLVCVCVCTAHVHAS